MVPPEQDVINVLVPEQGILFGFSNPEQSGKFKTPVAHTRLIKVETPLGSLHQEYTRCP